MIGYQRDVLSKQGWGEVHHSAKHDCPKDIYHVGLGTVHKTVACENSPFADYCIVFYLFTSYTESPNSFGGCTEQ